MTKRSLVPSNLECFGGNEREGQIFNLNFFVIFPEFQQLQLTLFVINFSNFRGEIFFIFIG